LTPTPVSPLATALAEARARLAEARRVVVLTGAGISAESKVPTFRGEGGLWEGHRPEELATPQAFQRDPARVWRWYAWRRGLIAACEPNPGHHALAGWLASRRDTALLVTQNVDGLHQSAARAAAGSAEAPEVVCLHGDLFRVRCLECRREREDRTPDLGLGGPPLCPECGGLLRPAVVWFGEALPVQGLERALTWAQGADLALVVGTSGLVHPAAALPLLVKERRSRSAEREHGHPAVSGCIVEVNMERTPLSARADVHLPGRAGSVLPALLSAAPPVDREDKGSGPEAPNSNLR
jgi:NAD-dependent deacetylase